MVVVKSERIDRFSGDFSKVPGYVMFLVFKVGLIAFARRGMFKMSYPVKFKNLNKLTSVILNCYSYLKSIRV